MIAKALLQRKIIHIDMDCFYAAVEMRDFPDLQNKPIAVGGPVSRRGVLSTCNYMARRFGVKSAMPTHVALKLCPNLIVQSGRMDVYKAESQAIFEIYKKYTDLIEPLSLDEAFLDVTHCQALQNSATWIAKAIRQEIFESRGLTASAGVAPNKSLAKIASDWHKPNGQKVIPPEAVAEFIKDLPVRKLFGVGPKMEEKLVALNIHTCLDLQQLNKEKLNHHFGKQGARFYDLSRGIDEREVISERVRKSISVEHTFSEDILAINRCVHEIHQLQKRLVERIKNYNDESDIQSIFVKIKFSDFKQTTIDKSSLSLNSENFTLLLKEGMKRHDKPIRLLGIGVRLSNNKESNRENKQLTLPW